MRFRSVFGVWSLLFAAFLSGFGGFAVLFVSVSFGVALGIWCREWGQWGEGRGCRSRGSVVGLGRVRCVGVYTVTVTVS